MEECIFCKIINKETPAEIVYEDKEVIVIKDINPKATIHLLIIPKIHISSLLEFQEEHKELLGKLLLISKELAKMFEKAKGGYKLAINVGKEGGQIVEHFHIHFLAGELTGLP
ncbi:histidine triad nucleotide-binding protein [bacterium]|nr:histidine triad nucleotide-binding protein [bacterium]